MNPKKTFFISRLAVLSLMLITVLPSLSLAAIINVNSTLDKAGLAAACQSGVGECTLRSAIQAANATVGVADTINLPAGTYTLTIPGAGEIASATGDLNISGLGGALTITGAGAATTIINGGALDGVFETQAGAVVTISDVTITNGNNIGGLGGGIHVGNGSTLTLNRSVVTANKAGGAAAGAGGVDNSGILHMNTVAVTNNDSTGGGVNNGLAGALDWTIGEVSGNTTGGGIQNKGTITLTNITVSGNNPSAVQGAGIDNSGPATLQNVTISGNTSSIAALTAIGGIRNSAPGTVSVRNTIISGNAPVNCGGNGLTTSLGNNLDIGATCGFAAPSDLPNTDPLLGALALNGGVLIKTRALPAGSPAIDKGSATVFPLTDARGIARPVDGNIPLDGVATSDIGAYEFRPQKITVTLASPFNFGTVTPGTAADHVVTLANIGDGALVIGLLAVTDPLAPPFSIPVAADTCSNKTLLRGTNCTFTARFSPTAAALSTDTFNIPSNDPAAPTVTFSLSGTGGIAAIGTTVNNPPVIPVLVSPANGLIGGGTTMTFVWNKSTDPDGDAVSYQLIYSTDPNFAVSQTQTVDVAAAKAAGLLFAGLGSMGGGIVLFGFVAGNGSRRSRTTTLGIIALILVGTLFTACGGGGGGTPTTPATQQVSKTITGLAANTTYYWKIVANDGKGGLTTSAAYSFKTL